MALNVFYSISPFGTGDIKVASNIAVSGGVATFSVAQTGNIGVGCHVISAGVDGYISEMTNSTTATIVTALGVAHGDVSSESLTSIKHEYASLSAFEAGFTDGSHINNANLVTADVIANACCYFDHDDQTPDTVALIDWGGTTDVTRYLKIFTPIGGTESINSQRHVGVWDDNKGVTKVTESSGIQIEEGNVKIFGLQIELISTSTTYRSGIDVQPGSGESSGNYEIAYNILKGSGSTNRGKLINFGSIGTGTGNIYNNIIYDLSSGGASYAIGVLDTGWTVNIFNNTVYNISTGNAIIQSTGIVNVQNNASFSNLDDFQGNWNTITHNASDDGDGTNAVDISPGGTEADDWNDAFTDYINGDFSVKDASSVLYNAGTDLSGSGVADDIIGTSRPQDSVYDIGAFEFVAVGEAVRKARLIFLKNRSIIKI